ncbi:hypothetical protein HOY80DRAFT_969368 [Tuber brumale]|nr:hypothetical protein HOY80DRAFT_969368 [Tuber brumale]
MTSIAAVGCLSWVALWLFLCFSSMYHTRIDILCDIPSHTYSIVTRLPSYLHLGIPFMNLSPANAGAHLLFGNAQTTRTAPSGTYAASACTGDRRSAPPDTIPSVNMSP